MRLIDADKLIDAFNIKCGEASCDTCRDLSKEHCMIYCTIDEQPTAYDAEEIEKAMRNACGIAHSCAMVCEVE